MKKNLDKIELFLLCFIAFVIPVSIKLSSIPMILLFIIALCRKQNYPYLIKAFKSPSFYILIIPYLFLWLGLLNSDDLSNGLIIVFRASPLILFPVIFTTFKLNQINSKHKFIFSSFVLGVLSSYIICLSNAVPKYIANKDFNVFFYQEFSAIVAAANHLSYFVLFGIIILISNLFGETNLFFCKKKYLLLKILLLIVFSIFLFQLSSKATIILFLMLSLIVFIYIIFKKNLALKYVLAIIAFVILLVTFGLSTEKVNVRFSNFVDLVFKHNEFDPKSSESTALRLSALKAGKALAKDNFWFGTGTGDLRSEMHDYYEKNYFNAACERDVSPHNQFVKTFAMHGVFGFVSLISIFVLLIHTAIKRKCFLLWMWFLTMLVLFSVEDMLGIQCGMVFFSFFTSYFIFNLDLSNNNQSINT